MWGALGVESEGTKLELGKLEVYIRRVEDEWRFAYSHQEEAGPGRVHPEEIEEWIRFITTGEESLELSPVLPDRPLVIRPESPVSIFPNRYASFYVAIPAWYRFTSISKGSRTNLIDIPSRNLSNTWFGDPSAGELCYALDAPLRRHSSRLEDGAVTCSLAVRNGSGEKLDFERICVHVENLSIFADDDERLWTNEIQVLFKGADQISQLIIRDSSPGDGTASRKLTLPRVTPNKNLLRRSFNFFRSFTEI